MTAATSFLVDSRDFSLSFVAASAKCLSKSNADFGTFDYNTFGINTWFKFTATGSEIDLMANGDAGSNPGFQFVLTGTNQLAFYGMKAAGSIVGDLITTATYTAGTWINAYARWDTTQTGNDKIKISVNGTDVSAFDSRMNPTQAIVAGNEACKIGASGGGVSNFNGLIRRVEFYQTILPSATTLYNNSKPLPLATVLAQPGVFSVVNATNGNITGDSKQATSWTNTNGVTLSTDVP